MYDMDGLAAYGDMGAFMDAEMLKEYLMVSGWGAGGILVTSAVVQKLGEYLPDDWTPEAKSRTKSLIGIALGITAGRMLYDRNRSGGIAVAASVAGLGLAELIASWSRDASGTPMLTTGLSGGAGLSGMDIAALEAAVVNASPAFVPPGLSGGTVVSRAGLQAPGVTVEQLGQAGYAPWMS